MSRRLALAGVLLAVGAWTTAARAASERVPAALPDAPPLPAGLRARLAEALAAEGPDYEPRTRHRRRDGSPLYTNRLLLEQSPYLRQHAHNPVDWWPWGDEAFAAARRLGRPVLVSIGYSTCHWCHVMEEESFDDVEIAKRLNAGFVAIKVDRELRPDVDAVYMSAIQALGRSGGWPLNVWVTPDRRPFYAGTYFPPADRDGRPGLPRVLENIRAQYTSDPQRIEELAGRLAGLIQRDLGGAEAGDSRIPGPEAIARAASEALGHLDWSWGGLAGGQKFPSGVPLRLLLRQHRRRGDEEALRAVELTLEKIAAGGIRDHVGGGFHRYSVDPRWLVPHFEKMLYDNALLAIAYLEAWQVTGRDDFARVVRDTLDYLRREMTAPGGGFTSATDADSPGADGEPEEGRFFTWTPAELAQVLGAERARAVGAWYGVTEAGHFEGRSVLHRWRDEGAVAAELAIEPAALRRLLAGTREELLAARARRPAPLRDDKVLAAWNGLAISAFARAGLALPEPDYVAAAAAAADFALGSMRRDGRLHRAFIAGRASGPAFLEDYAFLIAGLLDLYEARPDPRWLREALALQAVLDADYADPAGAYFQTAAREADLLVREKPTRDGAIPSGNSVAALNLQRLADLAFDEALRQRAGLLFSALGDPVRAAPIAFGELLLALDYHHDTPKEIVLVAPAAGGDAAPMLAALGRTFVPNRVLSRVTEGPDLEAHAALVPLLRYKRAREGRVTAYVCENRVCDLPTADPVVFAAQIAAVARDEPAP